MNNPLATGSPSLSLPPLEGSYDPALVALSLLAVFVASYTAFSLTDRPNEQASNQRRKHFWVVAGAIVLGLGIWAMHFIAMLAFSLPIPVQYDPWITLISVLPAILASVAVLRYNNEYHHMPQLARHALYMGGGIGVMHYTGMMAMHLQAQMHHHLSLVILSVIVAVLLAAVSLNVKCWAKRPGSKGFQTEYSLLMSSAIMALATTAMHYTAMSAAYFIPHYQPQTPDLMISHDSMAWGIGGVITIIVSMLFIAVRINRRLEVVQLLESSEAQLRSIIENTADAIIAIDTQGIIQTYNPAAEAMFGYTKEEVIGKDVSILLPNDEREEHRKYTTNPTLHAPRIIRRERVLEGLRKNGERFPIEINVAPMSQKNRSGFVGIARDITQRHLAEKERADAMARLDFLLSSSPVAIYTRSAKAPHPLIYVSPNAQNIMGCDAGQLLTGDAWSERIHPEDKTNALSQLQSLAGKSGILELEYRYRMPSGDFQWINDRLILPTLNGDKPEELVGSWTNIQDKKLVKLALEESEDRIRRSQNYANVGSWDWNIISGKLLWSERVPALFGLTAGEMNTDFEFFYSLIHPHDRTRIMDAINNCINQGLEYNIEHRCIWPDGSVRWLLERGDVIRDKNNKPLRMLGIVQDITQRKMAEQSSEEARRAAERASNAKSEFMSRMSHELRTPLNAVIGFAQLLEYDDEHPLTTDQQSQAQEIGNAGRHLLGLINDVLDLSAIEAGKMSVSLENVNVARLIQETFSLVSPLASRRQIQLHPPQKHQDTEVRADYTRLKQVLVNLVSNAIKYNRDRGDIFLEIEQKSQSVRISVRDTGLGLNRKQQEKLFQPFERIGAEKTAIDGAGIGLVISKQLIERMNGKIGVICEEQQGCTFWVELPRFNSHMDLHSTQKPLVEPNQQSITILYIEDNPANLRLMQGLIKQHTTHTLLYTTNPEEGMQLAKQQPDLIMLDIHLPNTSGLDILKQLKGNPDTHHIPVIAISAHASHSDIRDGLEAGFNYYITKPFKVEKLIKILNQFARK